jgi:hypothetical protein
VGTHRRISAVPSNPCAANAVGRTGRAAGSSPIDRPTDPSPRAVKGPRRQAPLRRFGFRGVAVGPLRPRRQFSFERAVAAISRPGRNVHRAPRGLDIPDSYAGATRLSPGCCLVNGIGAATRICVATGDFGETLLTPRSVHAWLETWRWPIFDRSVRYAGSCRRRPYESTRPSHHPASAASVTSRSALAPSNHSDMAAH